jgi:hypothetical protein
VCSYMHPRALYKMFPKSIGAQMEHDNAGDFWCIVEDITVPDMEKRRRPRENWGITEGKRRRIINLTDSSEKPLGQWNTMIIECVDRSIKIWVNGDLVNYGYNCTADKGKEHRISPASTRLTTSIEISHISFDIIFDWQHRH